LGWSYYSLGELGKGNDNYAKAAEYFDKAIELDADFKNAWSNKGLALWGLTKLDDAKKAFEKALEIDPDYSAAKQNLEILQKEIDKTPKAGVKKEVKQQVANKKEDAKYAAKQKASSAASDAKSSAKSSLMGKLKKL